MNKVKIAIKETACFDYSLIFWYNMMKEKDILNTLKKHLS